MTLEKSRHPGEAPQWLFPLTVAVILFTICLSFVLLAVSRP